jgi:hypothetical protein
MYWKPNKGKLMGKLVGRVEHEALARGSRSGSLM